MDFDNDDLLSLAIESVENEALNSASCKRKVRKKCDKLPTNLDALGNNEVFNAEQDDILALALDNVENNGMIFESSTKSEKSDPKLTLTKNRSLVDVELNFDADPSENDTTKENENLYKNKSEKSLIHNGDTDSSDDEDNKYFEESKYDSYGKSIKKVLKEYQSRYGPIGKKDDASWKAKPNTTFIAPEKSNSKSHESSASFDPVFGIRIVNPLVSSQTIKEKMLGRTPINFMKLKHHVNHGDMKADWVIAGVIVKKFPPRVSQNGSNYSNWMLSDLKGDMKTALIFLFGRAHDELWKTPTGTVLAILNPSVLKDNKNEYEAKLSIKSGDQVMIWGRSKDLGHCNFRKKNGENCGSFVNLSQCEFCVYHVQKEYKKFNTRSELQQLNGKSKVNLRNKVLGKNEVFYGGKSFSALPVVGKKANPKDKQRLQGLGCSTRDKKNNEPMNIPDLQRSNKMFNLLPSGNNLLPKKTSDDKRLSSLFIEKKPVDDLKHKEKLSTEVKLNTSSSLTKPLLSNPGTEILFDLEIPNSKTPPVAKESPKVSRTTQKSAAKMKLQQRFNSLVGMSSSESEKGSKSSHFNHSQTITTTSSTKSVKVSNLTYKDIKQLSPALELVTNGNMQSPGVTNKTIQPECKSIKEEVSAPILSMGEPHGSSPIMKSGQRPRQSPKLPPNAGMSRAKLQALQYIKEKGPIKKENPTGKDNLKRGIKRPSSPSSDDDMTQKPVLSERFLQLMNQKSIHEELIELKEIEQEFEYFDKMEKKDRLEEKMLNTYKVDCKAVRCLKCNYIWFSAADACKAEGHPIKVIDAIKRFFKCGKCSNRTVSLTIVPLIPCKRCFSSSWVRAPMIREKIVKNDSLSIRGGEQKFTNSGITNGSLDLLVPD